MYLNFVDSSVVTYCVLFLVWVAEKQRERRSPTLRPPNCSSRDFSAFVS